MLNNQYEEKRGKQRETIRKGVEFRKKETTDKRQKQKDEYGLVQSSWVKQT